MMQIANLWCKWNAFEGKLMRKRFDFRARLHQKKFFNLFPPAIKKILLFQSRISILSLIFILWIFSKKSLWSFQRELFDLLTNGFNVFHQHQKDEKWFFKSWILWCWSGESSKSPWIEYPPFIMGLLKLIPVCVRDWKKSGQEQNKASRLKQ